MLFKLKQSASWTYVYVLLFCLRKESKNGNKLLSSLLTFYRATNCTQCRNNDSSNVPIGEIINLLGNDEKLIENREK